MDFYVIIVIILAVMFTAFILGLRDKAAARKNLIRKLTKEYGSEPHLRCKSGEREHISGFYKKHLEDFRIDDTTWNDLDMDSVYDRVNYCLSAAGDEYLYYMLRSPKQTDDFEDFEKKIRFFQKSDEKRLKMQLIFSDIGKSSKYSIYDYVDYLQNAGSSGNGRHFAALGLMALSVFLCFFYFAIGFVLLVILMLYQIFSYFRIKSDIDPYLVTYGYIMRVIRSIDSFKGLDDDVFAEDVRELTGISKEFSSFRAFADILLSPTRMNSGGNPADLLMDYVRMVTHIDIIKFNQMYKEIIDKKDKLDRILEITGRIEAAISTACFRASFEGRTCIPEFTQDAFDARELFHPLIKDAVANDIRSERGVLLTGSNASGKSTFLKACAINAVLAQSLHTVLGSSYRAPIYRVYSSMALKDDIFEGDSYYIVEIKSIKRILDAAALEGRKVLCFVDEVLRGTNTVERIAASTQILKKLAEDGVQCFAATHDIELTTLLGQYYDIYHFEGDVTDNDVHFDYKIKEGPATTRNAIKLLGALGYDSSIVTDAQKMADGFLQNGTWVTDYEG